MEFILGLTAVLTFLLLLTLTEARRRRAALLATVAVKCSCPRFVMALTTSTEKNADVMTFVFPKAKLNSASVADSQTSLVQSIAFTALLNDVTTGGLEATTVQIQDTTLLQLDNIYEPI